MCVMANPDTEISPRPAKYLMAFREFLIRCKAFIVVKKKPRVLCERDTFIMNHKL